MVANNVGMHAIKLISLEQMLTQGFKRLQVVINSGDGWI